MTLLLFAELFSRLLAAIVCAAVGLIVWDIGTRSPAKVLAETAAAARSARTLLRGMSRFAIGLVFIGMSIGLLFFALPVSEFDRYTVYQIGAFLAALAVELLVGEDVRPLLGLNKGTRAG